jgi:hypothetical protein
MPQVISAVLALFVGYFTWTFTATLSKGAYPLGSAGMLEEVVFYAPIVGLILPSAMRLLNSKSAASAVWLLALSPFVGILNFIPFFILYVLSKMVFPSTAAEVVATTLSIGIWAFVFYAQVRERRLEVGARPPEKPVKLLRRPGRW